MRVPLLAPLQIAMLPGGGAAPTVQLDRGVFVLSIDTELMWGSFHRMSASEFEAKNGRLRDVIALILAMLDRYSVPVTWAMVGHLFLDSCDRAQDGRAHPDLGRPAYDWYPHDWYRQDPCTDLATDPLWYGADVVELVRSARTQHEIGSHSFAHLVFGDPGCPAEAARDDIEAWSAAARDCGISGRSFVFPRNRVGHLDLVAAAGFTCYRGYRVPASQSLSHRAPGALRDVLGMPANPSRPTVTASGLLGDPGFDAISCPERAVTQVGLGPSTGRQGQGGHQAGGAPAGRFPHVVPPDGHGRRPRACVWGGWMGSCPKSTACAKPATWSP